MLQSLFLGMKPQPEANDIFSEATVTVIVWLLAKKSPVCCVPG